MDNNQYPVIESVNHNNNAGMNSAPNTVKKSGLFIVLTIVAVIVIAALAVAIFVLSGDGGGTGGQPVEKGGNTATLQIYAMLEDKIPIDELDAAVDDINSEAVVAFEDGYGTISVKNDKKEYISFYFDDEEGVDEDESELDESGESTQVEPNVAYGFTYVLPIDDEDSITISCSDICYYNDGTDINEFKTKQEALDSFLAQSEK